MTKQTERVISFLAPLGRNEKENIICGSSLTDREMNILIYRFVRGLSLKESSERLNMEYDTFNKAQKRAIDKMYKFLFTS